MKRKVISFIDKKTLKWAVVLSILFLLVIGGIIFFGGSFAETKGVTLTLIYPLLWGMFNFPVRNCESCVSLIGLALGLIATVLIYTIIFYLVLRVVFILTSRNE